MTICIGSYKPADIIRSPLGTTGHCPKCGHAFSRSKLAGEMKLNAPGQSPSFLQSNTIRAELIKCL